ncbi:MAG TPA: PP2C family serine/threonine-protein phosphatase [Bellilinea sp.]|nr:PP2C family serine/threonine-protein phosphatase [Bellilinea sp.]
MLNFLKKYFSKKEPENKPAAIKTAPLDAAELESVTAPIPMRPPQLVVGTGQSVGLQRDHNEDTLYAVSAILADGANETQFGLFMVADGMGGYEYGEVASSIAARATTQYILSKVYLPHVNPEGDVPQESLQEIIENGILKAQQLVRARAPGGGTTLTAALLIGDQITVAHVGDSRAYFVHPGGRIELLTHDHSLVHRLVELGQITEEEALIHPNRNVLYRAIGQPEPFKPDIQTFQMPHPGYLLICSDGLWGTVDDAKMMRIVMDAKNPSEACSKLVEAANETGGPDNISVVLVEYL